MDRGLIYRKKQGFGAPMEEWFQEGDLGRRCVKAFDRSTIKKEGFLDTQYVLDLLQHQMTKGGGYGFHLRIVMNAILWDEACSIKQWRMALTELLFAPSSAKGGLNGSPRES
ncbi:MAG: asparagine synthase-related protein [Nitrospira sp.]